MDQMKTWTTNSTPAEQELTPEESLRVISKSGSCKARQEKLAGQWRDGVLRRCLVNARSEGIRKACPMFLNMVAGAPAKIVSDAGLDHKIWSFDFEGSTFIAYWRSIRGLRWEWVSQEDLAAVSVEKSKRGEDQNLLSPDKEEPPAWRNFRKMLNSAYDLGPERIECLLEAFSLEESTPKSVSSGKSPRC